MGVGRQRESWEQIFALDPSLMFLLRVIADVWFCLLLEEPGVENNHEVIAPWKTIFKIIIPYKGIN